MNASVMSETAYMEKVKECVSEQIKCEMYKVDVDRKSTRLNSSH